MVADRHHWWRLGRANPGDFPNCLNFFGTRRAIRLATVVARALLVD